MNIGIRFCKTNTGAKKIMLSEILNTYIMVNFGEFRDFTVGLVLYYSKIIQDLAITLDLLPNHQQATNPPM